MDWGDGGYELIAPELAPVAEPVVRAAAPQPGEHLADVGCGDGNAALRAATTGARVTGVDPSERLLAVAEARALAEGLEVTFVQGDAAAIPLPGESVDAMVSVFGVIFAPDAHAAAREMARVTAADGRIVLSAWLPEGVLAEVSRRRRDVVAAASPPPATPGSPPFAWHERAALDQLFSPYGFEVTTTTEVLSFVATSASEFTDIEFAHHPMWLEAKRVLAADEYAQLEAETMARFDAANEDPGAFRVTSPYVIAALRR